MLIQRILTALALIPLVLAALFYCPEPYYKIACGLIIAYAAWEWSLLMGVKIVWQRVAFVVLMLLLVMLEEFLDIKTILKVALFWWGLALIWILNYPRLTQHWSNRFILTILGVEVLLPTWITLVLVHDQFGPWMLLYVFGIVWGADTGGYFVGRTFGRRKLLPRVSPGKTIAGVFGGVVAVQLLALAFAWYFSIPNSQLGLWLLLAFVTSLISVEGDLLISMLKRKQGLKDTGNILPGHGGLLDRIDSLTAAGTLFTLGLLSLNFHLG